MPVKPTDRKTITNSFFTDDEGHPTGGNSIGSGFAIVWQNGIKERGGAFIEEVAEACIARLEYFQQSPFKCDENDEAIGHFKAAIAALDRRTARRVAEGTEGTYNT
jgi:hypothetical protein